MDSEERDGLPPDAEQSASHDTPDHAMGETAEEAPKGHVDSSTTEDESGEERRGPTLIWMAGLAALILVAVVAGGLALAKNHSAALATPTPIVPPIPTGQTAPTPVITGGNVAAVVNGKAIPMSTFRVFYDLNTKQAAQSTGATQSASVIGQQTMSEIVDQEVVAQYAAAHHITVSKSEIDQRYNTTATSNGGLAAFQQTLTRVGLTQAVYRQLLLGPSILAQKVVSQVAPLPKKAIPGKLGPVAHVRHILISLTPQGKPARTDAQAHARAQQVLAQLQHGASFAALVKKYSDDPGSISTGGAYTVHPKEMVPPFDHASFTLPLHKATIIHSQFGYHIIEVLSRGTAPGPSTSPQQVQQNNFVTWLNAQVKAAKIQRIAQVRG